MLSAIRHQLHLLQKYFPIISPYRISQRVFFLSLLQPKMLDFVAAFSRIAQFFVGVFLQKLHFRSVTQSCVLVNETFLL